MIDDNNFLSDQDLSRIEQLMQALDRSGLSHLTVRIGELHLTVGKGDPASVATPALVPPALQTASAPKSAQVEVPTVATSEPQSQAATGNTIKAPMMGRFYSKPDQSAAPFVKVGDMVAEDTTVCIIEVMKTFISVPAGVSGRIVEILIADEDVVEFDQPMFHIEKL